MVDGRYVKTHELSVENGDVLTTPLLPDLEIPLKRLFTD